MQGQYMTTGDAGGSGEPESIWTKFGNWADKNKDLILGGGLALTNFLQQDAANKGQAEINQAAAKWSGFQPGLLNQVKPIVTPNPLALGTQAALSSPQLWSELSGLYDAREKNQVAELVRKKEREAALNKALAGGQ